MPHTENCINIHCTLLSGSTRFRIINTLINPQRAPQISDDADTDDFDDSDDAYDSGDADSDDSDDAYDSGDADSDDSAASIISLAAR